MPAYAHGSVLVLAVAAALAPVAAIAARMKKSMPVNTSPARHHVGRAYWLFRQPELD